MPVTATSYEAVAMEMVLAALHASATYAALGGSASTTLFVWPDGNGSKIYAADGTEVDHKTAAILAHVGCEPFSVSPVSAGAPKLYFRSCELPIRFRLKNTPGDTPQERTVRALNAAGNIRAEIEAAATAASQWQRIGGTVELEEMSAPGGLDDGFITWKLTLSLGDDL